jgi:hypothetical protein
MTATDKLDDCVANSSGSPAEEPLRWHADPSAPFVAQLVLHWWK